MRVASLSNEVNMFSNATSRLRACALALTAASALGGAMAGQAAACDNPETTLRYTSVVNPDPKHPYYAASLAFKEAVEAQSNCRVQVDLYMGGQLGGDRETFEAITIGTQDLGLISSPPVSAFSNAIDALNLPWLFNGDLEVIQKVVDSEIGQMMFDALEADTGVKTLAVTVVPFRDIISVRPIKSVEDLQGFKMRVMQSPSNIATFKAVGANPTPIAWPEVYGAVQTGVVEGLENDVIGMYAGKLQEVAKNVTRTGHFNNPAVLVINGDVFNGLDPELQEVLRSAGKIASEKSYEITREQQALVTEILRQEGVSFHEIEIAKLRDAMGPVYEEATSASDVTRKVVEAVSELSAQ